MIVRWTASALGDLESIENYQRLPGAPYLSMRDFAARSPARQT
jgi:hypothetical protein